MKTIKINDKEYKVKYTIRALFYWEQITGKPFAINTYQYKSFINERNDKVMYLEMQIFNSESKKYCK